VVGPLRLHLPPIHLEIFGSERTHVSPFTQLVSPQAQGEAIAASVQLQQLPGYSYRPLDTKHGPWHRQPLPSRLRQDNDASESAMSS